MNISVFTDFSNIALPFAIGFLPGGFIVSVLFVHFVAINWDKVDSWAEEEKKKTAKDEKK